MRTLNILFLACVVLVSIAVLTAGSEPFVLEELHLIHWEDIPEGKPSYTGPASAAILMAWYAEHGYPELLPDLNEDGRIDEEDTILLARDFGEEMGGHLIDHRLGDPFIVYPLARYVGERYPSEFRMLIYDESFPEEVERDLGQPFVPTEVPGIEIEVHEDPFYELYVHHLEALRPGIVGIGHDIPEWNDFAVSRSYIPVGEPEGRPVDLVSTGYEQFGPNPVWETLMRLEPERWGFLMPEWIPFEILIILIPAHEADGAPSYPGDDPGDGPGGDPGDKPGDDPGGDPSDGPGDSPGGDPGDPGEPGDPSGGRDDGGEPGDSSGSYADVSISMKMVVPEQDPAAPGSQVQYNLNVWQGGPATAENVVVELTLPSSVAINASSGSAIQIAHRPPNDILRWDLGDLVTFPPGTSIWLQVDVDQDACGTIQYDFAVTSDTADPDLSNNSGQLTTLIDPCGGSPGTPPGGRHDGEPGGTPPGDYDIAGACCLPDGSCNSLNEAECLRHDGLFYGPGTACVEIRCFPQEEPPCAIIRSRVTNACHLYQGSDQPMIVKADFDLQNPGDKDALSVVVKLIAGVPLLYNLQTTYNDTYIFTIPIIPAGGSHQFSHTFSINPAPPQKPTGDTVVMVFAASLSPLCKLKINSLMDLFHLLYFGPTERICPDDGGTPPGDEGDVPGACCLPDGSCSNLTSAECDRQGGQFNGERTSCDSVTCDSSGEPDPDPGTGALPNLWVTDMTGCWTWSNDGREHVMATVTGVVHNGGQAGASNVKATITAGGKSTTVSAGTISAGGQTTVSATIDVGAYDSVSWPIPTSIEADPYHAITEADESNNTTNSSFPESSDCN